MKSHARTIAITALAETITVLAEMTTMLVEVTTMLAGIATTLAGTTTTMATEVADTFPLATTFLTRMTLDF